MQRVWRTLANMLGVGRLPGMPGTYASIVAAGLYWWLIAPIPMLWALAWVVAAALAGVWICDRAQHFIGSQDPAEVVWDELAGTWLALLLAPGLWPYQLAALVLFRLLDIWKPWPIDALQRLPGGWGIMADDLLAALLAGGLTLVAFEVVSVL